MDKELASFHTYLFSLCVNAAAAQATSTGNRQLKLTRQSWLPAEQYCQVEQASTAPVQTSWQTGLISLAMIATLPTYSVLYSSSWNSSHFLQSSQQRLHYNLLKTEQNSTGMGLSLRKQILGLLSGQSNKILSSLSRLSQADKEHDAKNIQTPRICFDFTQKHHVPLQRHIA